MCSYPSEPKTLFIVMLCLCYLISTRLTRRDSHEFSLMRQANFIRDCRAFSAVIVARLPRIFPCTFFLSLLYFFFFLFLSSFFVLL